MAVNTDFSLPLGIAWANHRENNNSAAISGFQDILRQMPENLDALYGLGLALRSNNQRQDAVSRFQNLLVLVNQALDANPGEDRYEMLQRMTTQRLTELGASPAPTL